MGDIEKLENVVSDHAISIALMTKAVSSIEGMLSQQTTSIKEIEKAMKSQELLMEKFTNMDSRVTDSVNRIHKRIDDIENKVVAMKLEYDTTCDVVRPMAHKGAIVHGLLVKASIGLAIAVAGVVGTVVLWALRQGAK